MDLAIRVADAVLDLMCAHDRKSHLSLQLVPGIRGEQIVKSDVIA